MQVIADGAFYALGQHAKAFIIKGCLVSYRAKISPTPMKPSCHSGGFSAQVSQVSHGHFKESVAPGAPRQRLDFNVVAIFQILADGINAPEIDGTVKEDAPSR